MLRLIEEKKNFLYYFSLITHYPFIPPEILHHQGPRILHVSDTPDTVFSYVLKLIKKTAPDYLIHTGDLVDNRKLEVRIRELKHYKREATSFLGRLEEASPGEIHLVPGNHDHLPTLRKAAGKTVFHSPGSLLTLEGICFELSHKLEDFQNRGADYYLYGHNMNRPENKHYLNGFHQIHVILPLLKEIYTIPYPLGTMEQRGFYPLTRRGV